MERLSPIGFWSYARQDDEASQGKLSSLRSLLMQELQQQYGREPVRIFQDVGSIPPGAEWEAKIRTAMEDSSFLIPIITPNFLQSRWCNDEVLIFQDREKTLREAHPTLKSQRLIFPIHYVDSFDIEPDNPDVLHELQKLQWFDFRAYRLKDYGQELVRERLSILARSLRDLLNTRLDAAPPPGPAPKPDPEPEKVWNGVDLDNQEPPAPTPVPEPGPAPLPRKINWTVVGPILGVVLLIVLLAALHKPSTASEATPSSQDPSAEAPSAAAAAVASSSSSADASSAPVSADSSATTSSSSDTETFSPQAAVATPSFDCSRASTYADHAICSDTQLADADREYDQLYRKALSADFNGDVRRAGRLALQARNSCQDPACVAQWYQTRIAELRSQ